MRLDGYLSDQRIGDLLKISPSTAATHIRNILRKAALHDRRDLLLLYGAGIVDDRRVSALERAARHAKATGCPEAGSERSGHVESSQQQKR